MLTQVLGVYYCIVRKNQKNTSTKQLITTTDHYEHITVYSLGSSILVLYEIVPIYTCRLDFEVVLQYTVRVLEYCRVQRGLEHNGRVVGSLLGLVQNLCKIHLSDSEHEGF